MSLSARRAWIEICGGVSARPLEAWSLSARRAWIEILVSARQVCVICRVALRKESVDRNRISGHLVGVYPWSLSARRAWIEICYLDNIEIIQAGRSPQGERG